MATNDIGIQTVESIFETLMIDEVWSVRRPRGFTWWSYRLAQHVEASEPFWDRGCLISKIRVWTEVANAVDASHDPATVMAMANGQETLSALVWDPAENTVAEYCTAVIGEEGVEWKSKLLANAAIMQNTAAHSRSHTVADALSGVPAASSHPVNGERPDMDEMLNAPELVIAPAGKDSSAFVGALTEGLQDFLPQYGIVDSSDADGFTCELSYTGSEPAFMLAANAPGNNVGPVETCLLRIFPDVEHPQYGHGALIVMLLPPKFEQEQLATVANQLNLVETQRSTPTQLLGAWCMDPTNEEKDGIAFNAFLPSALAHPGLLENQILFQAGRSKFFGTEGRKYLRP